MQLDLNTSSEKCSLCFTPIAYVKNKKEKNYNSPQIVLE
jgi:hypothetical protein